MNNNEMRNKIKNNIISLLILWILIYILLSGCQSSSNEKAMPDTHAMNVEVTKKFIGSDYLMMGKEGNQTIETMAKKADLTIVGQVMTGGSLYQEEVKSDNPKAYEKYPETTRISLTQYTIKIDQTLYGYTSLKEIQFGQIGVPGDDRGTTKVKQNDKMVLLLKKDQVSGTYYSVAFEDVLFTVSNENTVMSMSNEAQLMKYDNTDLGLLLGEITQAVSTKK